MREQVNILSPRGKHKDFGELTRAKLYWLDDCLRPRTPVFPDARDIFQQDLCTATKIKWFRNCLMSTTMSFSCYRDLQIPQISIYLSIHGTCWINNSNPCHPVSCPPRNLQDATADLQGSSEVHSSSGQGCFGRKRRTNTILGRSSYWYAWSVYVCICVGNVKKYSWWLLFCIWPEGGMAEIKSLLIAKTFYFDVDNHPVAKHCIKQTKTLLPLLIVQICKKLLYSLSILNHLKWKTLFFLLFV